MCACVCVRVVLGWFSVDVPYISPCSWTFSFSFCSWVGCYTNAQCWKKKKSLFLCGWRELTLSNVSVAQSWLPAVGPWTSSRRDFNANHRKPQLKNSDPLYDHINPAVGRVRVRPNTLCYKLFSQVLDPLHALWCCTGTEYLPCRCKKCLLIY